MTEAPSETKILSKITLKNTGCKPLRAKLEEKQVPLCQIYGVAGGTKVKVDNKGEAFESIVGDFECVNLETNEAYRSGVLYLPGGLHDMLASAFTGENKATNVEFAIEISSRPASNPIGYEYVARQLVKADRADPLDALRNKLKMLPAPNKPNEKKGDKTDA